MLSTAGKLHLAKYPEETFIFLPCKANDQLHHGKMIVLYNPANTDPAKLVRDSNGNLCKVVEREAEEKGLARF